MIPRTRRYSYENNKIGINLYVTDLGLHSESFASSTALYIRDPPIINHIEEPSTRKASPISSLPSNTPQNVRNRCWSRFW